MPVLSPPARLAHSPSVMSMDRRHSPAWPVARWILSSASRHRQGDGGDRKPRDPVVVGRFTSRSRWVPFRAMAPRRAGGPDDAEASGWRRPSRQASWYRARRGCRSGGQIGGETSRPHRPHRSFCWLTRDCADGPIARTVRVTIYRPAHIYLVIVGVILALLVCIIDTILIFEPFRAVARTVVIVIGVPILILVLLNFIGVIDGGPPRLRPN